MRFFAAAAIALLALTTGCSMFKPAEAPKTDVDDGSQWAGFNNGYAKGEEPKKNVPPTKAASSETPKVDDKAPDADKVASADEEAKPKKKGAKKSGPKKSVGTPAAKPRKRATKKT